MDNPIASSSRLPPPNLPGDEGDPRLTFQPASQAQILRAHQRDSAQISRLTDLVSEVSRSVAGTRWLAHKQTSVDLFVRALYLILTFGRGAPTLGEEYTDILPSSRGRTPSRKRRALTILFLLLPSLLTSPSTLSYLRNNSPSEPTTTITTTTTDTESIANSRLRLRLQRAKKKLLDVLESPLGTVLPEIHMVAFLFRGRFFELGRRLTGVTYISTLPAKPPEQAAPSYEPLGLLMLLPLLYRLGKSLSTPPTSPADTLGDATRLLKGKQILPLAPPLTPPPTAPAQTLLLSKTDEYDTPNTYLVAEAQKLPERQCTLCLEPRGTGEGSGGTVAVTECGHVFCWGCLGGLDKLECPLCRQTLRMERLVAAYNL